MSAAIKAGWTPEKRAKKAEQMRHRLAANHTEAAQAAGVPSDWKRCPECRTWKPRTDYQRNAARSDGIKPICRPCASAQAQRLRIRRKLG